MNQSRCMAHYLHRTMREAYVSEVSMKKSKGGKSTDGGASYNRLMSSMGI